VSVVSGLTRQPMLSVARELLPFIAALIGALVFLTFVPDFVLWLPRLLGYAG